MIKQEIVQKRYDSVMADPFNIDTYQMFAQTTAIYPGAGTGSMEELSYLGLGLASEAGEVAGKLKKYIRDGVLVPEDVIAELGGTLWYIVMIAEALGFAASEVQEINTEQLASRAKRGKIGGSGDNR